jgi:hypothetical protein
MGKKSQPPPEVIRYALSTGDIVVLPTESAEDLEQLVSEMEEQNEPNSPAEHFLVDQMIHARWSLLRFRRLEAVAFDRMLENEYGSPSADRRLLNTIERPGNVVDKLQKMSAAAERAYARALRDLTQLRAKAQKSEKQNKPKAADEWLQSELAKFENEPIDNAYIRFGTTEPDGSAPSAPDAAGTEPETVIRT